MQPPTGYSIAGWGGGTKIKDKTGIIRKSEQQLYIR